jgi:hypothetical protein
MGAVDFFAHLGHPCPPYTNPADHLLDVITHNLDEPDGDGGQAGWPGPAACLRPLASLGGERCALLPSARRPGCSLCCAAVGRPAAIARGGKAGEAVRTRRPPSPGRRLHTLQPVGAAGTVQGAGGGPGQGRGPGADAEGGGALAQAVPHAAGVSAAQLPLQGRACAARPWAGRPSMRGVRRRGPECALRLPPANLPARRPARPPRRCRRCLREAMRRPVILATMLLQNVLMGVLIGDPQRSGRCGAGQLCSPAASSAAHAAGP